MRTRLTLALALLWLALAPARAATVSRHELRVTLDPDQGALTGEATLTVAPPPSGAVELNLGPDFKLEEASLIEGGEARRLDVSAPQAILRGAKVRPWVVALGAHGAGERRILVRWSGKPPALSDAVRFSRDEVADMPGGYITKEGAFLAGDYGWYPTGDQVTSLYHLEVVVPLAWRVVSEGRLEGGAESPEGRRREIYDGVHPLEGLDLVAAPWQVREESHEGVRVAVYTLPGAPEDLAETYLKAVEGYLDRFGRRIGPHPWPQFVVAEHILPTGYGMPSFTLLGSQVMRLPFIVKTSLGHEVLHDWWGNGVYVDRDGGNWCEGLTTYMADHDFAGEQAPGGAVEYRRQILRDYAEYIARGGTERPASEFVERHDRADRALGYGKVAMIFHMLKREVGDSRFEQGLRTLFADHQFRRASWADIEKIFSRVGGRPLRWFFKQWVERPGAPDLGFATPAVTAKRAGERTELEVHLTVTPDWRIAVPVALDVAGDGSQHTQVRAVGRVGKEGAPIIGVVPGVVRSGTAVLDPDVDVFRRLDPREIPAALSRLFARAPDLVVIGGARGPETEQAARAAAQGLAKDKAPIRADRDVQDKDLASAPLVWLLGAPVPDSPVARWVAKRIPEGAALGGDALQVGGRSAAGADAAACLVLEHPAPGQGALGVLDALSPAAMTALARRVTHYGKYSFLLFSGDRPLVREVAPAPLIPTVAFGALP